MIKAPALRGLPKRETESFSPLALGMSMIIDYGTRKLTMGRRLPDEPAQIRLPMRHHRLSLVKGLINEQHPTYFVVDTGGEVISISIATAEAINAQPARKIGLRVYGTSGWDRDAFLLPGQRLRFAETIDYQNFSVVVLNLRGAERAARVRGGRHRGAQVPERLSRRDGHGPQPAPAVTFANLELTVVRGAALLTPA